MLIAFTSGGAARGGDIGDVMISQITYQVKMTCLAIHIDIIVSMTCLAIHIDIIVSKDTSFRFLI
jgi:hypothetical protein